MDDTMAQNSAIRFGLDEIKKGTAGINSRCTTYVCIDIFVTMMNKSMRNLFEILEPVPSGI